MSTLDTKENENNWFLGAKGLEVFQEGLRGFTDEKIKVCRDQILEDILKSLPPDSPKQCSECTSNNLLPGHFKQKHINDSCPHRNPSKCYGYSYRCNTNLRRTCPNDLCSDFYDKIVLDHATRNPLLTNTDPNKWCTDDNGWNYAKCFQTTKNTGLSAEQTDASGSLQILIHNSRIQQFLDCSNVGAEDSPFKKALDIRNEIFHKPKLEIEESTLGKYFETFIEVLQDKKCLINDERAKTAVKKLQELEKNRPTIYKTDVDRLLKKRDEVLHDLEEFAQKLQDKIGYEIEEKITKEFIARCVDEIQKTAIPPRFTEELIQWYIKNKLSLQLSMTDDSVDADFEDLYVKQELSDHTTGKLEKIKSLKDLFTSNVKVSLDIFLCSIVGAGNTTFAKYLTKLWCQSHGQSTDHNDYFQEEDLKALRDIDFVFLLNLTDSSSKCETEDMIYDQIIQNLSYEDGKSFLKQILNNKRCLIILDESDRWEHPCNACTKPFKGIPHRYASDNIIVLTIARQRKLVKINNSQINKEIEINCLGKQSKKQLQINVLKRIAEKKHEIVTEEELKNQQEAFQNEISAYNLDELASDPRILVHLVCLWHDDCFKVLSECQVYGKIIEMILSTTQKKFQYFQTDDFIQLQASGYKELLDGLGNLASHSFKGGKTIARSVVNKFLKEEQAKLCLISGILSESNGKICSEENNPEIYFTFENIRKHFRQRLQKSE